MVGISLSRGLVLAGLLLGWSSFAAPSPGSPPAHAEARLETRDAWDMNPNPPNSCPKRSVGFYVNWAIYARKYEVTDLKPEQFTHINYAFANVNNKTGAIELSDLYADTERKLPGDKNETGPNVYGNIKQLFLLKKRHRNLKVLLSLGGWTFSPNFAPGLATEAGRQTFADSGVQLIKDFGFDGLDFDYEWAKTAQEVSDFVDAVRRTRAGLDAYAARNGFSSKQFLLTMDSPAGPKHYGILDFAGLSRYLDFFNLMAYDYAGATFNESNYTGNLANWYPDHKLPQSTPYNTQQVLDYYIKAGVAAEDIVIGCPLYGRSFPNTRGMGQPFSGEVANGTWEKGVYDWKVLPLAGSTTLENLDIVSSWSVDQQKCQVVSYDDLTVAKKKADLVNHKGLGGLMWWETSGDRQGAASMVQAQVDILQQTGLEQKQNCIHYPESKYDNLRNGFPDN